MDLCSGKRGNNHEEICYEGGDCPLCRALDEIESAGADLDTANSTIADLENKIATLKNNAEG